MWVLGLYMCLRGALGESLLFYDLNNMFRYLIGVFVVKLGFYVWNGALTSIYKSKYSLTKIIEAIYLKPIVLWFMTMEIL